MVKITRTKQPTSPPDSAACCRQFPRLFFVKPFFTVQCCYANGQCFEVLPIFGPYTGGQIKQYLFSRTPASALQVTQALGQIACSVIDHFDISRLGPCSVVEYSTVLHRLPKPEPL